MSFDKDFIYGIDLNRAAVEQHGAGATAVVSGANHMWNWQARKADGSVGGLDMQLAATRQYGAGAKIVSVGAYANDWRVIKPAELKYKIIPIMYVTQEKIWDPAAVKAALDIFETHLMGSQEWMRQKIDKTFDLLQPLVVYTSRTTAQFNAWNTEMSTGPNPFAYFDGLRQDVQTFMGSHYNPTLHKYLVSVYGAQQNGSAAASPVAVVASEVFTNPFKVYYPDPLETSRGSEEDNAYAILHELGHTFGFPHQEGPTADTMLMWNKRVPYAELSDDERATLLASPFFK